MCINDKIYTKEKKMLINRVIDFHLWTKKLRYIEINGKNHINDEDYIY